MPQKLYVVITMDCERPATETHASASGPPDYATSAVWTRAYTALAAKYDWPVTFFIHPEAALNQTQLFLDLEREGHCLALHLHPWRFGKVRFPAECGGLSEDQLREAMSEASALWAHAFGKRPLYFRPGAMSANDSMYPVLAELGFRGVGVSMPGRFYPQTYSNWWGAEPDPHRANRLFRQVSGDLDLANMPSSVDFSSVIRKNGCWYHWDLRPDFPEANYEQIARNIVQQIAARKPAIPCINQVTHNDHDYTDPNERNRKHYERTLAAIATAAKEFGYEAVGATLADITDMVLAQPPIERKLEHASGKIIFQPGVSSEIAIPPAAR
jgi:peptidoglycan/xylan/chitin deacetylase (PgdA/CDA1 family)